MGIGKVLWWMAGIAVVVAILDACNLVSLSQGVGVTMCLLVFAPFPFVVGRSVVLKVTGNKAAFDQVKKLKDRLASLKAEIAESDDDDEGDETSIEKIHRTAGEPIELAVLAENFGGEKSVGKLRAMYIERRDFVRGIVGPRYLASQDGGKKVAAHTSEDDDEDGSQSA